MRRRRALVARLARRELRYGPVLVEAALHGAMDVLLDTALEVAVIAIPGTACPFLEEAEAEGRMASRMAMGHGKTTGTA